jgi:signal transduction histidine kinase
VGSDEKPGWERENTDESLRAERKNTDQVLERTENDEDSDEGVERARGRADDVLDEARTETDQERESSGDHEVDAVAIERAVGDEVLRAERAGADERLRFEREEQARALAALLPLERAKTDRHLVTERASSDEAIASRDDFLGMASHDLRNLLSGIAINAALVLETATDAEEDRETISAMKGIQLYIARMNRLIGDLVDVVSIDAGRLAVHPKRGDVAALIAEAVSTFSTIASDKGIALEVEGVDDPLVGVFDHERLLQVLANLLTNAFKFTPSGGRVAVRAERQGAELRVTVSDTGAGIPNDMLDAVFERFWQVLEGDKRGMGLGLHITRCIVEAHGGKIWIESTMGQGSAFHFTIPDATLPDPEHGSGSQGSQAEGKQ